MDYEFMRDFQRAEESLPPAALAFTGDWLEENFGPNGPDEDDIAAMNLAMEKDMADRERSTYSEREVQDLLQDNDDLREEVRRLKEQKRTSLLDGTPVKVGTVVHCEHLGSVVILDWDDDGARCFDLESQVEVNAAWFQLRKRDS